MKIVSAERHQLRIPIESGGPHRWGAKEWKAFDFALLEVRTDDGLNGWGQGRAYTDASATAAALKSVIVPQIIGE